MTVYPWIAIGVSTWLAVAGLFGVFLGRLIAFGVDNDSPRAPHRAQRR